MSDEDIKLDRKMLAKINNQLKILKLKILSNRMDFIEHIKLDMEVVSKIGDELNEHSRRMDLHITHIKFILDGLVNLSNGNHTSSNVMDELSAKIDTIDKFSCEQSGVISQLQQKVDYLMRVQRN